MLFRWRATAGYRSLLEVTKVHLPYHVTELVTFDEVIAVDVNSDGGLEISGRSYMNGTIPKEGWKRFAIFDRDDGKLIQGMTNPNEYKEFNKESEKVITIQEDEFFT